LFFSKIRGKIELCKRNSRIANQPLKYSFQLFNQGNIMAKAKTSGTFSYSGTTFFVEISPCSWMYSYYGLQVQISLRKNAANLGSVFVNAKNWSLDKNAEKLWLPKALELAKAHVATKKGFAEVLSAEKALTEFFTETLESEKREEARRTKRMLALNAKGFRWFLTAWIHTSGDDRCIEKAYVTKPTKALIATLLGRSAVKTDYTLVPI
jgi:hypothetical protein